MTNDRHIDGHHKLIRYGMVTHGAIDGATRTVLWLSIENDNFSTTPRRLFHDAIGQYGCPSRIKPTEKFETLSVKRVMMLATFFKNNVICQIYESILVLVEPWFDLGYIRS